MHPHLNHLIDHFRQRTPLRTGSLIVTIFGDCIAARGGEVWLGSLIAALQPLQVSHRLVRTAVYRLIQDNILSNEQVGRRSFYRLTPAGQTEFGVATQRIYGNPEPHWDGRWLLVLTTMLEPAQRRRVKAALHRSGFAALSTDLFAHPCAELAPTREAMAKLCDEDKLVWSRSTLDSSADNLRELASRLWSTTQTSSAYAQLLALFEPLSKPSQLTRLSSQEAFLVRTFLIHEYRKVILRDPGLPEPLLPPGFPRKAAYELTRDLYQALLATSEQYVDSHFENQVGALPPFQATPRFAG